MKSKGILDSGAFTAFSKKTEIDVDEYIEFIKKHGHYFQGGWISLDSIGDGEKSYRNWEYMRQQGIDVIPVFHINTDEKWLEKYMQETNYIAIGVLARNLKMRAQLPAILERLWKTHLLDNEGNPKVKVHGLGMTTLPLVIRFPWYSVDSFSAAMGASRGIVLVPELQCRKGGDGKIGYKTDFSSATWMEISSRCRRSYRPSGSSYHALPPLVRKTYLKYFEERGYSVTPLENSCKRPLPFTRMKKTKGGEGALPEYKPLFDSHPIKETAESPGSICLTDDEEQRFLYNLDFWKEFQRMFKTPIIYHSPGNLSHIINKGLPFLLSYFPLRNEGAALKKMIEILGGENSYEATKAQQKGESVP